MKSNQFVLVLAALLGVIFTAGVRAQGTAFTYQGQLLTTNGPAHGTYDLTFALYHASSGGIQVGSTITDTGQSVTNGLFAFTMDFGAGIFNGTSCWLQISVRTNGAASFVTLMPRQKLTPTPYAITAGNVVSGGLPATYSSAVNFNNAGNSFSGSGAGLTSLNASSLSSGTVPDARLSANVALLDRNQTFTGNQTFAGQLILPSPTADLYSGGQTLLRSDGNKDNFFAGLDAGNLTVSGIGNTASGYKALVSDTSGYANTANGAYALYSNTNGGWNTAEGGNALYFNTSGNENTAVGFDALFYNTNGYANTASGFDALFQNASGINNTANGAYALYANSYGSENTAVGVNALYDNTGGYDNTASGYQALSANTVGGGNTASGANALLQNMTGNDNTAVGFDVLYHNTGGSGNTAGGADALSSNTGGSYNTADGYDALYADTNGSFNTAIGGDALMDNKDGTYNTVVGYQALISDQHGSYNTAIGYGVLANSTTNGGYNTAVGVGALRNASGQNNIALGGDAGSGLTTGSANIDIGNSGYSGDIETIRIGDYQTTTFIAGIDGATIPVGAPVYIGAGGQLGTITSSQRFKQNIQNMGNTSDELYSLQPVTFQYKPGIDPAGTPEFGLVAEQVEKVDPALVVRDDQGRPYTVRYQAVNAMLLNEFLKEHRKVEDLEARVEKLEQLINADDGGAR